MLALAVSALAAGLDAAQFSSAVSLVEVYASVTDATGDPITNLRREDFTVTENGVPQAVSAFAAGDFPLSVAVGIDRSFSMADRLPVAKSAARTFLGELRPADDALLVAIGSEVTPMELTNDRSKQYAALNELDTFGSTSLYDAIVFAIDAIQKAKGRRALVLLSDGSDRYSTLTATDALERARRSDVMIYPIALGRERPPVFAELATVTGGRSFHVRDTRTLPDTLRAIARELRYQYLLGYTPSRPIVAGQQEWRSIGVTVTRPGARVRARDGYLAR
jgi:Ca-activated chloride channel family protein